MHKFQLFAISVLAAGLLAGAAQAATYQLAGGVTLTGEAVSPNEKGVLIRQEDGSYSERVAWDKFSEDDLKKLLAASPRIGPFIESLLEPTIEEKVAANRAAIVIKNDFERLPRPEPKSLVTGLFSTGIGLLALFLIYAGNLYAGYEVSIFRAREPGLVCGVSALLPIIGPIIFLCMPTQVEDKSEIVQEPVREKEAYHVGPEPVAEPDPEVLAQEAAAVAAALPPTQTFARGQCTFNRRFFETRFPGFFTMVRREADRDLVLLFKTMRGEYAVQSITRIEANELHLQVQHGDASEEVMVPFLEIQEIQLKHKDA